LLYLLKGNDTIEEMLQDKSLYIFYNGVGINRL
jgi:hypothetical protein